MRQINSPLWLGNRSNAIAGIFKSTAPEYAAELVDHFQSTLRSTKHPARNRVIAAWDIPNLFDQLVADDITVITATRLPEMSRTRTVSESPQNRSAESSTYLLRIDSPPKRAEQSYLQRISKRPIFTSASARLTIRCTCSGMITQASKEIPHLTAESRIWSMNWSLILSLSNSSRR